MVRTYDVPTDTWKRTLRKGQAPVIFGRTCLAYTGSLLTGTSSNTSKNVRELTQERIHTTP